MVYEGDVERAKRGRIVKRGRNVRGEITNKEGEEDEDEKKKMTEEGKTITETEKGSQDYGVWKKWKEGVIE